MINTGTLDVDWNQPSKPRNDGQSSSDFDWSQPVSSKLGGHGQSSSDFDWSQPVSSKLNDDSSTDWSQPISNKLNDDSSTDWSQPVSTALIGSDKVNSIESLQSGFGKNLVSNETSSSFDWSTPVSAVLGGTGLQDTSSKTEQDGLSLAKESSMALSNEKNDEDSSVFNSSSSETQKNDAIAQRLKFRACLKLVVEELCTLPHHCEIHNKDLRSTFTAWLKKEFDLIHRICDFKQDGRNTESLLSLKVSTPTPLETGKVVN